MKHESLNGIKRQFRESVDRAAEVAGRNHTVLTLSPKAYREFVARLDAPPKPNKRLLKTMRTPAPWE